MDSKQMKECVTRLYNEVYTKGNWAACDELCDPQVKLHDQGVESSKPGMTYKESEKMFHKAFPNKQAKIEEIYTNDDKVIVLWSCRGKQEGELYGHPATHRPVQLTGMAMYRFKNGKICEIWQCWDRLSMLEQLGIAQPAHAVR